MAEAPSLVINLPSQPAQSLASASTIVALRALASMAFVNGENIAVDGSVSLGDGGGGLYTWDDLSTQIDDGIGIIKPNDTPVLSAGRWKLIGGSAQAGFSHAATFTAGSVGAKLKQWVSVDDAPYNAVGNGEADDSAAFIAALAASNMVVGTPGKTYYVNEQVTIAANNKRMIGNGATIKCGFGDTTFFFTGADCRMEGWQIDANGALYAIRNDGQRNDFLFNTFTGNVGHYIFNTSALWPKVIGNKFECESAAGEVTTAVIFENCQHFIFTNNTSNGVPVGWTVQARVSSRNGIIANNTFRQFIWQQAIVATALQTVFNFTLGSKVSFKGIQINGLPLSTGYTVTGTGPAYTVTFTVGRTAGQSVKLLGYRGAENVQINTSAFDIVIANNVIDGTGDSGLVILGDRIVISGNIIKNAAYCGIALYGGQNTISVTGNIVSDCSQLDDGMTSPDNPMVASVFNGAILISGADISCTGNTIVNNSGTMAYGIRVNVTSTLSDGSADPSITIGNNSFSGTYTLGKYSMPNDAAGVRVQSVMITDGVLSQYPARIDLDQAWTNKPPNTAYFEYGGLGATIAIRDTVIKQGGTASIKTVVGEYMDIQPLASAMLKNQIAKISFWAKNDSGSSYCTLFSTLAGLQAPITLQITDTAWRQYHIFAPFTDNLTVLGPLRFGATTGFANIQHIEISSVAIPK